MNFKPSLDSVPTGPTAEPLRSLGRASTIDDVFHTLEASDVLIESHAGMGAEAVRHALAESAAARGFTLVSAGPPIPRGARLLIIVDLDGPADAIVTAARERDRLGARVVSFARPQLPFTPAPSPESVLLREHAHVITLGPLTRAETEQLAAEMTRNGQVSRHPCSIERRWSWGGSFGFAELTESLMQDAVEAPDVAGSLGRFSQRTIVIASEILTALPSPLLVLACRLLPLVGVSMSRLDRVFDRAELGLLAHAHVIGTVHGVLTIAAPLQAALRLFIEDSPFDDAQTAVLSDVLTSIEIGAEFSESELAAVSNALTEHSALRDSVPGELQHNVLVEDMWFARRRGDAEGAAMLARRLLAKRMYTVDPALRLVACLEDDDLEQYAAHILTVPADAYSHRARRWLFNMQFPLLTVAPGAFAMIDTTAARFSSGRTALQMAQLRRSIEGCAALDAGDTSGAITIAEELLADPTIEPMIALRAFAIIAGVHASCGDSSSLTVVTLRALDFVMQHGRSGHIDGDLANRQALDVLLLIGVSFAALGVDQPHELTVFLDAMIAQALLQASPATVTYLTLAELLQAVTTPSPDDITGRLRFLRRKRPMDTSAWILALTDGQRAAPPARIGGGAIMMSVIADARLLSHDLRMDVPALVATVDAATELSPHLGVLARAFVAVLSERDVPPLACSTPPIPGTLPAAMTDVVLGHGKDAEMLRRGASVLLHRGAVPAAIAVLELTLPLVAGDVTAEREVRRALREARSRRRPGTEVPNGLTAREREIAALAAAGMTNREIARELFLSVRTVESHLYRAMRKTAVTREGLWVTISEAEA